MMIKERIATPVERLFTNSPFSIVTMVARIKGSVTEGMLKKAVLKVQQRHFYLQVRIKTESDGNPWFTTDDVGEIPIQIVSRKTKDDWIKIYAEASKIPFEFDKRPAVRFILVQSPEASELIILCHHIICDGLSLAYLARDLMVCLGDLDQEVETLPVPNPINLDTIPDEVFLPGLVKYMIGRINRKWQPDKVFFDQEDYQVLTRTYWENYSHQLLVVELSKAQTTALVERSRMAHVTVNTALAAAFVGAQRVIQGDKRYHSSLAIAASVRDRLTPPVGDVMGFYAGVVMPKFNYDRNKSVWENARKLHKKVQPLYANKKVFNDFVTWLHLDPTILEAINFKKLGSLMPAEAPNYNKLAGFSQKQDVVLGILKRDKMDTLDTIMGTAVTNLGRLDFPTKYGNLELDRLIMQPGGAFPLVNVNLVLGAVTCAGRLSLVMEYSSQAVDAPTMELVKDKALDLLEI